MDFDTWEPAYEAILADFGYDRRADERARDDLARLCEPFELDRFADWRGVTVAVCGAGPSLPADLDRARRADAVVAASTAADVCREHGVALDCMVTDLDKNPDTARTLTREGVPVAVHAHGDNRPAVREVVATLEDEHVLPTTQAAPRGPVENFGGFTDGDRAAFLADALGAGEIALAGWDLADPSVGPTKRRKLAWAGRLLAWLGERRGERFRPLDGRRGDVDPSWTGASGGEGGDAGGESGPGG